MGSTAFKIKPGIYVVPNHGRVNANNELDDKDLLALYTNSNFPFIHLLPDGVKLLKAEKLSVETLTKLIYSATSINEVDLLLKVKKTKALEAIAIAKKESFK